MQFPSSFAMKRSLPEKFRRAKFKTLWIGWVWAEGRLSFLQLSLRQSHDPKHPSLLRECECR